MSLSALLSNLVDRLRGGDDRAFEDFMNTNHKRVYTLAFRITGDPGDAEDVVQEVFLRIHQRRTEIRGETVHAWMLRIATNCAYDRLRKKKREPLTENDIPSEDDRGGGFLDQSASGSSSAEELMLDAEQVQMLKSCLSLLCHRQFACIQLKYFEEMEQTTIAQTLGISDATVSREIKRAEAALRQHLEAKCKR